jgi:hypothetical protein
MFLVTRVIKLDFALKTRVFLRYVLLMTETGLVNVMTGDILTVDQMWK